MKAGGRARSAVAWFGLGALVALLAQVVAPLAGPPLYDGVVTVDTYRFVAPVGGENGGAQGVSRTFPVAGSTSPTISLGTPEQPPQAQLIAGPGAFILPAGTTSIVVSISPVAPTVEPTSGTIAGNVYGVALVDQRGVALSASADAEVTLALRAPDATGPAVLARREGPAWVPLRTEGAAVAGTWETAGLTNFGEFALVASAGGGVPSGSLLGIATAVLLVVALVGSLIAAARSWWRRRPKGG